MLPTTGEDYMGKWKCKQCGECCHKFEMFLKPGDPDGDRTALHIAETVARNFGIRYRSIKVISCTVYGECRYFDKKTKLCTIYKERPPRCKSFFCRRYKK